MDFKSTEKSAKRALGSLAGAVLPSGRVDPAGVDWEGVRRILLVRQDMRIGDLVMNTPLFHATRARFPKAYLALLLREGYEELYEKDPYIDELILFRKERDLLNPVGLIRLRARLKAARFDLAVDCSNFLSFSLTNGLITLLSGAPLRVGFEDKESPAFLNILVPCAQRRHYVANQLELLSPAGASGLPYDASLHLPERLLESGRRAVREMTRSNGAPTVVLFTGAGNRLKQWGIHRYVEVAEALSEGGANVLLAAGPGDSEVRSAAGRLPVLPPMSIGSFAATIRACDVLVCGDTGPLHLGAACGVPTVSVFLEDNVARYGYHDERSHIAVRVTEGGAGVAEVIDAARRLIAEKAR